MTAAHCTDGSKGVDVLLGAHNINHNENTQVTIRSQNIVTHEHWQPNRIHNDIGLIQLAEKAPLSG